MISRSHRFRGINSLRPVYRHGQTVRGPFFSVKSMSNPKRSSYRLAVVVSRKVDKSAVARNRIRRRFYEAVRQFEDDIASPFDIVATVFPGQGKDESGQSLVTELKRLFKQAGIFDKPDR
ncbi:MAG: ribonuclease P protein component [Candidatus Saccharimonadales bacterium]